MMNPGYLLSDIVERHAFAPSRRERIALSMDGIEHSYARLAERSRRLARGLAGVGLRHGDRVAVLMGNGPAWVESLLAIASIGAVCVPVNVLLNGREIEHVLHDSGAVALLADTVAGRALAQVDTLPPLCVRVGEFERPAGGVWYDYEALVAGALASALVPGPRRPEAGDAVMTYYTSGTTGLPKGAVQSHAGVLWNAFHQIHDVGVSSDDVYLLIPSLSWSAGFHDVMLALMWLGGRIAMTATGGLSIDRIAHAVEAERATHVLLVPTLLKQLVAAPDVLRRLRGTRLRRIFTGGEMVPPSVVAAVHEALPGCRVVQIYGMSEFPLMMTIHDGDEAVAHPERTGRASSIVTLGVRRDDGMILGAGEGEVVVRSPATMLGYHGKPEATAEAFQDGWFRTGDTGHVDEEGWLTLTGRSKDMIISGGLNVYAREVEDVVHAVPGVRDVAVVGVPDDRWGEVPVAIVVADPADSLEQAVRGACEQLLSTFKRPRHVFVRAEPLPRTPTGKVLKRELRPWAERQVIAASSRK